MFLPSSSVVWLSKEIRVGLASVLLLILSIYSLRGAAVFGIDAKSSGESPSMLFPFSSVSSRSSDPIAVLSRCLVHSFAGDVLNVNVPRPPNGVGDNQFPHQA